MSQASYVYCGSWGFQGAVEGILGFRCDGEGKTLTPLGRWGDQLSQSILAVKGDLLFSINERRDEGKLTSYRIAPDGSLTELDCIQPGGVSQSYLCPDPAGPYLLISSMGRGAIYAVRFDEDGKLTHTGTQKFVSGHSILPRQMNSRVHGVFVSPDGGAIIANNHGVDEVILHTLDRESGALEVVQNMVVDWGQAPRHAAWHPSSRFVYVVTELGNRVYAYALENGRLHELAAYPTLARGGSAEGSVSDVVISADGKFLYAANRGQNNIASWRVNGESGLLDPAGHASCGGDGPRGLCLGCGEEVMLVANNGSGDVAVIERDPESGLLGGVMQTVEAPNATCVRWVCLER